MPEVASSHYQLAPSADVYPEILAPEGKAQPLVHMYNGCSEQSLAHGSLYWKEFD